MSINNSIKLTLNIKDENITFSDNCVSEETIKNRRTLVYEGKLSYIPKHCEKCGVIKDSKIIKHGFKVSFIKVPKVSKMQSYIKLHKQRYLCKHCNSTFTCSTNIVDTNCFISSHTKHSIALDAIDTVSEKHLAKHNDVSYSTVARVIDSYFSNHKLYKNFLPEVICFDEFKSTKDAIGNMSFICADFETGKPINIFEDRRLHILIKEFSYYTHKARSRVKYIVIDMYMPYIQLIKKMFPNAEIVTDKFHVINLLSRSLNKTRIGIMKHNKKFYRKLKRYWRLFLKDYNKVDKTKYQRWTCFNNFMTEQQILEYMLNCDEELKKTYWLYQELLMSVNKRDIKSFSTTIHSEHEGISSFMMTSINTLKDHEDYIINCLSTNYTNGLIEGINNKIKVIKRVSYGYRSFIRFRRRILICFNLIQLKKTPSFTT